MLFSVVCRPLYRMYPVVGEAATVLRVTLGYSEVQVQVADVFFDISRHRVARHRQTHNSPITHP